MDSRFLQWLIGGLFLLTVAAFVANTFGEASTLNALLVTSCTTLIGSIIGGVLLAASKKKP